MTLFRFLATVRATWNAVVAAETAAAAAAAAGSSGGVAAVAAAAVAGAAAASAAPSSSSPLLRFDAAVGAAHAGATLHVVVGNEACDADSTVSALTHAWWLAQVQEDTTKALVLPVVSCASADWVLRREASYLLRTAAAAAAATAAAATKSDADLVFLDDVPVPLLVALAAASRLRITLVDHNKLTGSWAAAGLGDAVWEIVDHHIDAGAHSHMAPVRRTISFEKAAGRGIGSTCSLVADELLKLRATKSDALDAAVARLLLGVVLLDTVNLNPAAGRTTPADTAATVQLVEVIEAATHKTFDSGALYHTLNAIRDDPEWWLSLTTAQALSVDYKAFDVAAAAGVAGGGGPGTAGRVTYGSATLGVALTRFLGLEPAGSDGGSGDGASDDSAGGAAAMALDASGSGLPTQLQPDRLDGIVAVLTAQSLPFMILLSRVGVQRQLAIVSLPSPTWTPLHHDALVAGLTAHPTLALTAVPAGVPPGSPALAAVFLQGDLRASRKQVVPYVDAILAGTAPWLAAPPPPTTA